ASNVGKSVLATALCRIFRDDGFSVAPFKAQNMSLNSFVTPDGGEIGRAQAAQAEAAGIAPSVEMNPVLLKPEGNSRSQVVVNGKPWKSTTASKYYNLKSELWPVVTQALDKLRSRYQIVVIEGAGSPAEINLAKDEIVNMRLAKYCQSPVLLVGDIDCGGVFASLLGTLWLLPPEELGLVKGLVINKFRGDLTLLEPGIRFLEEKSGLPVTGVIPYFRDISVAPEDSVALEQSRPVQATFQVDIAVIRMPHISNFDDFDPLAKENGIRLRYVNSVKDLGNPDLIILPGSKTTVADLDWLRENGLAARITELYRQGAFVIGICGGYQMLGRYIDDPDQVESTVLRRQGLGLLPITTTFLPTKETHQVKGEVVSHRGLLAGTRGITFEGYEIHMGRTEGDEDGSVFCLRQRSGKPCEIPDGYLDSGGQVLGTYIHGLFGNEELRRAILSQIVGAKGQRLSFSNDGEPKRDEYNKLADLVRSSLDMDTIYNIAGLKKD
ncbi:MAG: cobyric acid synthase, partial [Dehalococcoidales bacterium]|nr:cobyric acid synthase [Dehalococcoidales bacterium]